MKKKFPHQQKIVLKKKLNLIEKQFINEKNPLLAENSVRAKIEPYRKTVYRKQKKNNFPPYKNLQYTRKNKILNGL